MERTYGSKYEAGLPTKDIAKRVRADLKAAMKAGDIPTGLKFSIRTDYNSIRVEVTAVPDGFAIHCPERVAADLANEATHHLPWAAEGARKVLDTINTTLAAYNYDGSDTMTDYFDVNFYSSARFESRISSADRERVVARLNNEPEPDNTPKEFGPEVVVEHMTKTTHWVHWSVNEISRDMHVGADRARKVLEALAHGNMLHKTWSPGRRTVVYRLPKEGDTPETNETRREWADKEAAKAKAKRDKTKAKRAAAKREYDEQKAAEAAKATADSEAEKLARVTRAKAAKVTDSRLSAAQAALDFEASAKPEPKPKAVTTYTVDGPVFMVTKYGVC